MDFGSKLKYFAKNKYKKIKVFAEILGKDEGYLQKIFTGKLQPGKDFLVEVMKLGCDMEWLLNDSLGPEDFPGFHPKYVENIPTLNLVKSPSEEYNSPETHLRLIINNEANKNKNDLIILEEIKKIQQQITELSTKLSNLITVINK